MLQHLNLEAERMYNARHNRSEIVETITTIVLIYTLCGRKSAKVFHAETSPSQIHIPETFAAVSHRLKKQMKVDMKKT